MPSATLARLSEQPAEPVKPESLVRFTETVSPEFREQVLDTIKAMPPAVHQLLHDKGWQIEVGSRFLEVAPHMANRHPPGRVRGTSYDTVGGMSYPHSNPPKIYLAENVLDDEDGRWHKNGKALGDLRHEIGHAVDDALGRPSERGAFARAHRADVAALDDDDADDLSYYAGTTDNRGPREAFAETFAVTFGGGCRGMQLGDKFPGSTAVMRQLGDNLHNDIPPLTGIIRSPGERLNNFLHDVGHLLGDWRHRKGSAPTADNTNSAPEEPRKVAGRRM